MTNLLWVLIGAIVLLYWWHSGDYKGRARELASQYCARHDLQLLDQSMVITAIWPDRGPHGGLALRRSYQFEFTSTGEQRYLGKLLLLGRQLKSIELEAYKLPESE